MKSFLTISLFIFFCTACGDKETDRSKMLTSWEVNVTTGDTINRMDGKGKKQGLWIENSKKDTIIYKDGVPI